MSTTGTTDHEAAGPWGARDGREAAGRLLRAATRSGAHLVAEAAALVQGWAVLADPIAGAVYSTPASAAADGVHAAAAPQEHPYCVQLPAAGAILVLAPAPTTPAEHTGHVAATTAALLEVRGQRAAELRGEQMRLHTTLIRLLLAGHTSVVTETLGRNTTTATETPGRDTATTGTGTGTGTGGLCGNRLTHVTVYRLAGADIPAAHQVLWRAVRPSLDPYADACTLLGRLDGELVVAELHHGGDDGRVLRLVSRVSERHHLLAGMAGPLPLAEMPTAHSGAAAARHSATPDRRIVPADAVGSSRLAPLLPTVPYARWAQSVLRPLAPAHRHLLLVWLRTGSKPRAAAALGLSAGTVRARIRELARLLGADLEDATAQAHLLLALRAPGPDDGGNAALPPGPPGPSGPDRLEALPDGLLDTEAVRSWAYGLVGGLEPHLRIALACWLRHHARTAPAAAELHVHRTTLTSWLGRCAEHLAQNLADATVRAELHLALRATRNGPDDPAALPRRGGRTYRRL
ncbi:helix-turn-helix domain-containing protein [Streptomyces sp. ME02-6979.5a]|uniref:helix-turn-helix domain-containing protein n=1 Tax=Streptomyces sp. ME02-6979.5a TaxID=462925 RepID=UPI0029B68FB0|nr:helix-turn-helix domain-containing protein [Streptomyces sp. ME02-6979.5a]MDX3336683.1 helix-turn-helix domain-containing protein [Streptomyces sp. ME02-6979.5a]